MAQLLEVDLIVRAVAQGFDKVAADMGRMTANSTAAQGATTGAGKAAASAAGGFGALATKVGIAAAGIGTAAITIRKGYQLLSEGADIQLVAKQFDNLAASIDTTAESLLTNLRRATAGMMTDAEMMESASSMITLGLGETESEVVRLATVVSKLGWDMNQVILTFANNSTMRLDALGLSVQGVTDRAKELEKAGMSADKAFDMAVIEAGEAKIELLGDTAATTAGKLAILEAGTRQVKESFASFVADVLEPAITTLAQIATAAQKTAEAIDKMQAETPDAAEQMERLANSFTAVANAPIAPRGAFKELRQSIVDLITTQVDFSQGVLQTERNLQELNSGFDITADGAVRLNGKIVGLFPDLRELALAWAASTEAAAADEVMLRRWSGTAEEVGPTVAETAAAIRDSNRALADHGIGLHMSSQEAEDLAYATGELGNASERMAEYLAEDKAALEETAAAADALTAAYDALLAATIQTAAQQIATYYDALAAYEEAQGEWKTATRDTSDEIAAINAKLAADLSDEQRKAWQDVAEAAEEGSERWLAAMAALEGDLSSSARNDLVLARAEAQAAMGEEFSYFTGDLQAMEEAQEAMQAAVAEMFAGYADAIMGAITATGGFDEVAAQTAVALGLMSEAEAEARLQAAQLAEMMLAIGVAVDQGKISPEQAAGMFAELATAAEGTAAEVDIAMKHVQGTLDGVRVPPLDTTEARNAMLEMEGVATGTKENIDRVGVHTTEAMRRAMLEMEGVLAPQALDTKSHLDAINNTPVIVKTQDEMLIGTRTVLEDIQEDEAIINESVVAPDSDTTGVQALRSELQAILDMIGAINNSTVDPGGRAGGGSGGGAAGAAPAGTNSNGAGAAGGSGGSGRGRHGADTAPTSSTVVNNFMNGVTQAAMAAAIAQGIARYTRSTR